MQVVLVMFRADGERRSFSVVRDMTVIGRREDCDLRIPLGEVSRKHCRLIKDGDVLRLEDLGSSNGTYHNETRVQEAVIAPGDSVRVGPVFFVVQIDGVPADEEVQAPMMQEGAAADHNGVEEAGEFTPIEDPDAPSGQMANAAEGVSAEGGLPDFDFTMGEESAEPQDDIIEFGTQDTPASHEEA